VSPDGRLLAVARPDRMMTLQDLPSGKVVGEFADDTPSSCARSAAPHGRQQRGAERRLALARFAGDRDPAAQLHHRAEERGGLFAERVEGDVTSRTTPHGRRQAIRDGRDRCGETG
jgi:hypothetical protein